MVDEINKIQQSRTGKSTAIVHRLRRFGRLVRPRRLVNRQRLHGFEARPDDLHQCADLSWVKPWIVAGMGRDCRCW